MQQTEVNSVKNSISWGDICDQRPLGCKCERSAAELPDRVKTDSLYRLAEFFPSSKKFAQPKIISKFSKSLQKSCALWNF